MVSAKEIRHEWYVVDASNQVLGRLATRIATVLAGKHRPHSGYPGGLREKRAREVQARHPERLIEEAVKGMLGKSKLGRKQIRKLKVYKGVSHPHDAQKPKALAPVKRTVVPRSAPPRSTEAI